MQKNTNKTLNFVFWGTPDVARDTLQILKEDGYVPSLVITAPDRPQGRKMLITPPPAKVWAIENNVPCIQPETLTEEIDSVFKKISESLNDQQTNTHTLKSSLYPELSIVVAYGKIIPENIINLPRLGSINIHYSILPKYRGASPVESAILNGDKETGVSIQKMEYKMDTGPIIALEKTEIGEEEKSAELKKRLIKIGGNLLVNTLPLFIEHKIEPITQNDKEATYCKKIKKEDGLIDLTDNEVINYNKFRAYAAWPRTFFFKNKKRIIITDAELKNNQFVIKKVIPEGGKEIDYKI